MEKFISISSAKVFIIIGIIVSVIITVLFVVHRTYSYNLPIDNELFGQYGDIIGGVVGTFFTLLGNILLFYTINLQQDTIKLQQHSIALQQNGVKLQQDSIKSQTSESSFNQIVTLMCNQQTLLENKFKNITIYKSKDLGLSDIMNIKTFISENSPVKDSVFANVMYNKTDRFINLYRESICAFYFMIEKKDKDNNFYLPNNVDRHHLYLLIKINFHVSDMIELLKLGGKYQDFEYKKLLEKLMEIEKYGNESESIQNGSMKF